MQSGHFIVRHQGAVLLQIDILEGIFKCLKGPLQHSDTAEARQRQKETVTIIFEPGEREEAPRITESTLTLLLKEFTIGNEIGGGCTNIAIHVPGGCNSSSGSDLQGGSEVEMERCKIWQKFTEALDVAHVLVSYAAHVAKIINTPYKSDLDPWLADKRTPCSGEPWQNLRSSFSSRAGPLRKRDSLIKHVHTMVREASSGERKSVFRKLFGRDVDWISGNVVL